MKNLFKDRRNWPAALLLLTIFLIWSAAIAQQKNQVIPGGAANLHGAGAPSNPCAAGTIYTNDSNGNGYTCNAGSWQIVTTAGGGVTASAGQSLYANATNSAAGGTIVLDMAGIAGADLGAQMNNCATALPAAGGICKGDNLTGALTLSTAVTTAKPVVYTFSGQTISQSAAITLANASSGINGCAGVSPIFTKAGNIDQITASGIGSFVSCVTLVGVGGSFTGNGIVISANTPYVEFNNISGEAAAGISNAGSGDIQFNVVSSTSTGHAITMSGNYGSIFYNIVTSTASDAIFLNGANFALVEGNTINLTPAASTSGLCALKFTGDQIGNRSVVNQILLTDTTNSGNVDNGVCDLTTSGHNLNLLFMGDSIQGSFSGTETAYGYVVNNAGAMSTNWSVTFRDEACVHVGAPTGSGSCLKNIDANSNLVKWEDTTTGDGSGYFDGTTTSNGNVIILQNVQLAFANLPTNAANGSQVYCSNCTSGGNITQSGGAGGTYVTRINGNWYGQTTKTWSFIQGKECNASASSVNCAFTTKNIPGDLIVVGVQCFQGASPTLTVTDTSNTYTSAIAIKGNSTPNAWEQIFYAPAIVGGANTVAFSSSVNACTFIDVVIAEYSGLLPISPEDGAGVSNSGNSTLLSTGAIPTTQGDVVIAYGISAGAMTVGGGANSRAAGSQSLLEDILAAGSSTTMTEGAATGVWAISGVAFKVAP
jgi:hypothetical protein